MSSHQLMNQFIIPYLSGLCCHVPSVVLKYLGMAYVSLFLILFKILMTWHLQLPVGQIQCFLTYNLFPYKFHYILICDFISLFYCRYGAHKAFEISNSIWNSRDSASNTWSDLTVVWKPLQVQLMFQPDVMASAMKIQTYNLCNTWKRFWKCMMHFVCTEHLVCLAGEHSVYLCRGWVSE